MIIAQDAMEQLTLDEVRFIPSFHAPLRDDVPTASPDDRVAMLDWATAGEPRFVVDTIETDGGKRAYTVDTVTKLRARYPAAHLFWIVGADHVGKFSQWHQSEKLLEMVEIIVVARPGQTLDTPAGCSAEHFHLVTGHPFEVSSTEIRQRIVNGQSVRFFLPPGVVDCIEQRKLYRD